MFDVEPPLDNSEKSKKLRKLLGFCDEDCRGCPTCYNGTLIERILFKRGTQRLVAYYASFPDVIKMLEHESEVYRLIQGKGIGSQFVGYVTENGSRIIGFVVESDEPMFYHSPVSSDRNLKACKEVLAKLHRLGIGLGMIRPDTFYIKEDGTAIIKTFDACELNASRKFLDGEMQGLKQAIDRPGCISNLSKSLKA